MSPRGSIGRSSGGGDFRRVLGRIFGDSENPLGWALTIGTVAAIRVRLHLLFIIFVIAQLLTSIARDSLGIGYTAILMGALFVIVLLHEFGHCIACRRVGGEADEILMWPLGGLAMCNPPHEWRAHLVTALGGPAVNVVLLPITSAALALAGLGDEIIFNPLKPTISLAVAASYWTAALWIVHYVNIVILGFNLLAPMFPLDGGRVVQAILWRRMGFHASMDVACVVGMVGAGVLIVVGIVGSHLMLAGIGLFSGMICWYERRRLRAADELGDVVRMSLEQAEREAARRERGPSRSQRKRQEREQQEQAELDRILAKIASDGMGSLTAGEKKTLKRATERRRDV